MWNSFRQNTIFFLLVALSLNILAVSALGAMIFGKVLEPASKYDIIDCADATGSVRKCIRVDAGAGEFNDVANGANYRVIYGH